MLSDRPRPRAGFAVLMVMLVVTSGVAGPALAGASTAETQRGVITIGPALCWLGMSEACDQSDSTVEKTTAVEDLQQQLDLYSAAATSDAQADGYRTTFANFLPDSKTVAGMKAKARMIELINNGTTNTSFIRDQLNQTIEEYYVIREYNLMMQYKAEANQIAYMISAAKNDSGIPEDIVIPTNGNGYDLSTWSSWKSDTVTNVSYPLLNGTNITVPNIRWTNSQGDGKFILKRNQYDSFMWGDTQRFTLKAIQDKNLSGTENTTTRHVLGIQGAAENGYKEQIADLKTTMAEVKHRYSITYLNSVVDAYQSGEINTTDLTTPSLLAQEWATKLNDTQAATYKWASLAALGLDSPNLTETGHMTINYNKTMPTRHVTFNTTGVATSYGVKVYVEDTGETYKIANGSSGETWDQRVAVPMYSNVTLMGTDRDNQSISISEGNTVSYAGVQVKVQDVHRGLRQDETGMLFARDAPDGGFVVGATYDADTRTMFWVPAGENTSIRKLSGNVTIVGAEDRNGNELNAVGVVDYNYQTTNASELTEMMTQLSELRELVEQREPITGGGGGGGGFGGGGSPIVLAAVLALVVGAMVYSNDGNGGRR
jgi:hypothetical protein